MTNSTNTDKIFGRAEELYRNVTIGEVVDTNDPQQMGRVRVICAAMGDNEGASIQDLPWATCITPFAGREDVVSRGRDNIKSDGPMAYGMWNIPKVGSHVVIACVDGDTRFRIWLGCLHPQFTNHTEPHGRYIANGSNELSGPFTSSESPIEPISTHQQANFTPVIQSPTVPDAPSPSQTHYGNFEFMSRGADYAVAGIRSEFMGSGEVGDTRISDDDFNDIVTQPDGVSKIIHQNGYVRSRSAPNKQFAYTDNTNYDPQVYSWTTPGFHSIAMDDSATNCRIRFRTTHGNQIILDDTNERIYVSTPDGKTWIEMDEKGNVDVFASRNLSFRAEGDINLTADKSIRMTAKEGIHMESDTEFRIHSKQDLHIKADSNLFVSATTLDLTASVAVNILGLVTSITGTTVLNLTSTTSVFVTATTAINQVAGTMLITSSNVNTTSPASPGVPASTQEPKEAYLTNRVPEHEPWARVMTQVSKTDQDTGNTHTDSAEFPYNSTEVGKTERGVDLGRNKNWHR